jgi:hypothetical protein
MKCPSCTSERCGNHAACARRKDANVKLIKGEIMKIIKELGDERGYPLTIDECVWVGNDYMKKLSEHLSREKSK